MTLNNLTKTVSRSAKRLGRGLASGKGKTAGRGTKGQKSRSGYNIPRRFEGGQTSMIQRLPKVRGFKSKYEKDLVITLEHLEAKYADGETVSFKTLITKGLIKNDNLPVKIIGGIAFTKKLILRDVKLTKKLVESYAQMKLEAEKSNEVEKSETTTKVKIAKKPVSAVKVVAKTKK